MRDASEEGEPKQGHGGRPGRRDPSSNEETSEGPLELVRGRVSPIGIGLEGFHADAFQSPGGPAD